MMKIIIIGSGPAGLWLAGSLRKHQVILIDKNKEVARKLLLTGNTRCNITNIDTPNQFIDKLIGDKKIAHNFIHNFNNKNIVDFFNDNNCKLKQEDFKYFPISNKAKDVVEVLKSRLNNNIEILLDTKVIDIIVNQNKVVGVKTNKEEISADIVVVATGGLCYPKTGSDGDGYKFFKDHEIEELYPMECGVESLNPLCKKLQGQSFNGVIKLNNKNYNGIFLMTHYGVSGPLILELSQKISKYKYKQIYLSLLNHQRDETLINHIKKYKNLNQALLKILSPNLIKKMFDQDLLMKNTSEISKSVYQSICNKILHIKLDDIKVRDFNSAFVTGGGLKLNNFNKYLESKKIKGLFALGEILNLHGPIGGYNITLCFSQAQHIANYLNNID